MGGKGWRRREKNYRAAHGGYTRLPPPPDPSQVDALPSKLRKLISFTSAQLQGPTNVSKEKQKKRKRDDDGADKKSRPNDESDLGSSVGIEVGSSVGNLTTSQLTDGGDDVLQNGSDEKKKKKRKRKQVTDLRFDTAIEDSDRRLKKRERKKKYLEARKKKHKKTKTEEDLGFPTHEHIKFGDVVQAPPKLVTVPKAMKIGQDASQERIRLRAIEAYRNRKGWASRPGIKLPPAITSLASE